MSFETSYSLHRWNFVGVVLTADGGRIDDGTSMPVAHVPLARPIFVHRVPMSM